MRTSKINSMRRLPNSKQCGAALAFVLVMLVVMALLGIAALTNTKNQELMATNLQETVRAFQAADSGNVRMLYTKKTNDYTTAAKKFSDAVVNSASIPGANKTEVLTNSYSRFVTDGIWGRSKGTQKVVQHDTPVFHFEWRTRAETPSKAAATVYQGVMIIGALDDRTLYTTGVK